MARMREKHIMPSPAPSSSSTVTAVSGIIEATLDESPTTGYSWTVVDLPGDVVELGNEFMAGTGRPLAGGSGRRIFRFRVERPGIYVVRFALKRPWGSGPLEEHVLRLIVRQ